MNLIRLIDENAFVFAILVIYFPIHLFEEAIGNFPKWMHLHKWVNEEISYGHWMANNVFFYYSLLLLVYIIYCFTHAIFLAYGIILWGIINMLDHMIYSISDQKKSPGIFSGFLYGIVSTAFIIKEINLNRFNIVSAFLGLLVAIILAGLPILLAMGFHKRFKMIFGGKI